MLKPTGNRIVVLLDESLPTESGIYLAPDVSKWREASDQIGNRGTVVAIGPGKRHPKTDQIIPMQTRVGDVVRFSELEFYKFSEEGRDYALISEMDVVGVEEPDEAIQIERPMLDASLSHPTALCAAVEMLAQEVAA